MRREFSPFLRRSLLAFTILAVLIGLSIAIWSVVVRSPPSPAFNIITLVLGTSTFLLGLWGLWQRFCTRCCLSLFLVLGVLLTILDDTAIVLVTILNYDVAKRLAYYDMRTTAASSSDMAQLVSKYESKLKVPSYILLAAMILQTIACICLCLARLIKPFKSELGNQDEEHSQRSTLAQVQLESLKKSTSKQSAGPSLIPDTNLYASSHSMYKSVSRKLTNKYGEFTDDPAFQQKWWNRIPGL